MVEGGVIVQFQIPDWWDEWVVIDEEKLMKGEDGWSLKEGAPARAKREFKATIEMIKMSQSPHKD
jgi:hypothetical protein